VFLNVNVSTALPYSQNNISFLLYAVGIDCGDPGEPQNGTAIFDTTFFGDTVDYECDAGFRLVGDSQRTCQSSGSWSGNVPECQRKWLNICNVCCDCNLLSLLMIYRTYIISTKNSLGAVKKGC